MPVSRSQVPLAEHSTSGCALLAATAAMAQAAPLENKRAWCFVYAGTRNMPDRSGEGIILGVCLAAVVASRLRLGPTVARVGKPVVSSQDGKGERAVILLYLPVRVL